MDLLLNKTNPFPKCHLCPINDPAHGGMLATHPSPDFPDSEKMGSHYTIGIKSWNSRQVHYDVFLHTP